MNLPNPILDYANEVVADFFFEYLYLDQLNVSTEDELWKLIYGTIKDVISFNTLGDSLTDQLIVTLKSALADKVDIDEIVKKIMYKVENSDEVEFPKEK